MTETTPRYLIVTTELDLTRPLVPKDKFYEPFSVGRLQNTSFLGTAYSVTQAMAKIGEDIRSYPVPIIDELTRDADEPLPMDSRVRAFRLMNDVYRYYFITNTLNLTSETECVTLHFRMSKPHNPKYLVPVKENAVISSRDNFFTTLDYVENGGKETFAKISSESYAFEDEHHFICLRALVPLPKELFPETFKDRYDDGHSPAPLFRLRYDPDKLCPPNVREHCKDIANSVACFDLPANVQYPIFDPSAISLSRVPVPKGKFVTEYMQDIYQTKLAYCDAIMPYKLRNDAGTNFLDISYTNHGPRDILIQTSTNSVFLTCNLKIDDRSAVLEHFEDIEYDPRQRPLKQGRFHVASHGAFSSAVNTDEIVLCWQIVNGEIVPMDL